MTETLAFATIRALLPHGHPMVLVDRVRVAADGRSATAVKAVSGSEPCYGGLPAGLADMHYVFPTSLLIESFGQAAAVLWLRATRPAGARLDQVPMFVTTRDCVFSSEALPGDVLTHVVKLQHASESTAIVSGRTCVRAHTIASFGSLMAVVRSRSELAAGAEPARPEVTE